LPGGFEKTRCFVDSFLSYYSSLVVLSQRVSKGGYGLHGHLLIFGLLGALFYALLRDKRVMRKLFWGGYVPSVLAGLVISWTSFNGLMNMCLGMMPGILLSSVFLFFLVAQRLDGDGRVLTRILMLVSQSGLVVAIVYGQVSVYGEGHIRFLRERVRVGPFQGMWTQVGRWEPHRKLQRP